MDTNENSVSFTHYEKKNNLKNFKEKKLYTQHSLQNIHSSWRLLFFSCTKLHAQNACIKIMKFYDENKFNRNVLAIKTIFFFGKCMCENKISSNKKKIQNHWGYKFIIYVVICQNKNLIGFLFITLVGFANRMNLHQIQLKKKLNLKINLKWIVQNVSIIYLNKRKFSHILWQIRAQNHQIKWKQSVDRRKTKMSPMLQSKFPAQWNIDFSVSWIHFFFFCWWGWFICLFL